MKTLSVTKKFEFCYGHYLPEYAGNCSRQHGHNSVVEIEVANLDGKADLNDYPGMVIDFKELKRVGSEIIDLLDHQNLNEILSAAYHPPTAENICRWIFDALQDTSLKNKVIRVRVSETPDSWAEIKIGG